MNPILFAADDHYGTHGGKVLYEAIAPYYPVDFFENDWSCFHRERLSLTSLLILNMISGTCRVPPPPAAAADCVRDWLTLGHPVLLLHGASAAFWPWDWWRPIVGFRWVRRDDPDGFDKSVHPRRPYEVRVAKTRHALAGRLVSVSVPEDELYIRLEQTAPVATLMETETELGTFPVCYETITPWNGRMIGYLPGHAPEVVRLPGNIANIRTLIEDLWNNAPLDGKLRKKS